MYINMKKVYAQEECQNIQSINTFFFLMKQKSDSLFPSENKLSKYRHASIMGVKEVNIQIC